MCENKPVMYSNLIKNYNEIPLLRNVVPSART